MRAKFNFEALRRRMEELLPGAPEVVYNVQPVMLVGDASRMTSGFDSAEGMCGFQQLAIPGQFSIYELWSRAPGGLVIDWWTVFENGIGAFSTDLLFIYNCYIARASGLAISTVTVDVNSQRPCNSTHGARSSAVPPPEQPSEPPVIMGGKNKATSVQIADGRDKPKLWVPPGKSFYLTTYATAQGASGLVYFHELEAIPTSNR